MPRGLRSKQPACADGYPCRYQVHQLPDEPPAASSLVAGIELPNVLPQFSNLVRQLTQSSTCPGVHSPGSVLPAASPRLPVVTMRWRGWTPVAGWVEKRAVHGIRASTWARARHLEAERRSVARQSSHEQAEIQTADVHQETLQGCWRALADVPIAGARSRRDGRGVARGVRRAGAAAAARGAAGSAAGWRTRHRVRRVCLATFDSGETGCQRRSPGESPGRARS